MNVTVLVGMVALDQSGSFILDFNSIIKQDELWYKHNLSAKTSAISGFILLSVG